MGRPLRSPPWSPPIGAPPPRCSRSQRRCRLLHKSGLGPTRGGRGLGPEPARPCCSLPFPRECPHPCRSYHLHSGRRGRCSPPTPRPSPTHCRRVRKPGNECSSAQTVCPVRCWCGVRQAILSRNAQDGCRGLGGGLRIKDGGAPPKGQGEGRPKRLLLLSRSPGPHIPPSVITLLPSTGVTSPRLLRGSLSPNNPASPPVSVPFKAGARLGR